MMKTMTFRASTHSHQRRLPEGLIRPYQVPTPNTPVIPFLCPGDAREAQAFSGLMNSGELPPSIRRRRMLRWARYPHPAFIPQGGVCRAAPKDRVIHYGTYRVVPMYR
jgi:hypothetical protein